MNQKDCKKHMEAAGWTKTGLGSSGSGAGHIVGARAGGVLLRRQQGGRRKQLLPLLPRPLLPLRRRTTALRRCRSHRCCTHTQWGYCSGGPESRVRDVAGVPRCGHEALAPLGVASAGLLLHIFSAQSSDRMNGTTRAWSCLFVWLLLCYYIVFEKL